MGKPFAPHQLQPEPSPELEQILSELESADEQVRAAAVRKLCPCRGTPWELPVFERVYALRSDPSPLVRNAVQHDLRENPDWNARAEARRLESRERRRQFRAARAEAAAGLLEEELPPASSQAWRKRRKPRR